MYGHAYMFDGSQAVLEPKYTSDFGDYLLVKTFFTDNETGYKLRKKWYRGEESIEVVLEEIKLLANRGVASR